MFIAGRNDELILRELNYLRQRQIQILRRDTDPFITRKYIKLQQIERTKYKNVQHIYCGNGKNIRNLMMWLCSRIKVAFDQKQLSLESVDALTITCVQGADMGK